MTVILPTNTCDGRIGFEMNYGYVLAILGGTCPPGGGYSPGHPWYWLLGGPVTDPLDVPLPETDYADQQLKQADALPGAEQRHSAYRRRLASVRAGIEKDLAQYWHRAGKVEQLRVRLLQGHPVDALIPPEEQRYLNDSPIEVCTNAALCYNHVVYGRTLEAAISRRLDANPVLTLF